MPFSISVTLTVEEDRPDHISFLSVLRNESNAKLLIASTSMDEDLVIAEIQSGRRLEWYDFPIASGEWSYPILSPNEEIREHVIFTPSTNNPRHWGNSNEGDLPKVLVPPGHYTVWKEQHVDRSFHNAWNHDHYRHLETIAAESNAYVWLGDAASNKVTVKFGGFQL